MQKILRRSDRARSGARLPRFASFYSDVFNFYRGNLAETEAVSAKYLPECEDLYSLAERLQSLANGGDYEILRSAMCGHVFPRLPSVKAQDQTDFSLEFKAYRDLFKKEFSALRDKFFSSDEADILRDARRTASLERALAAVSTISKSRPPSCSSAVTEIPRPKRKASRKSTNAFSSTNIRTRAAYRMRSSVLFRQVPKDSWSEI